MRLGWVCAALLGVASVAAQESSGSIAGAVVDVTGNQIPDATVTIVSPVSREAKADSSGAFLIGGLAPGEYTLRVQDPGFRTKELEVRVGAGEQTSLGRFLLEVKFFQCLGSANRPRLSEVKLPNGDEPAVSGTARVEGGAAVEDVMIRLSAAGTSNVLAVTRSDRKGDFKFAGVKPGLYDLEFSFGGSRSTRVPRLRVRKAHALEILLTWKPWPAGRLCL